MAILTKRQIEAEYRFAKKMTVIEPPGDCDDHIRDLAETCLAYRDAALAFQELNVCYRLNKRPTEHLFARLERARKILE